MKFPPRGMSNDIEMGWPLLPPVGGAEVVVAEDEVVVVEFPVVKVEEEVEEDVVEVVVPPDAPDICPT